MLAELLLAASLLPHKVALADGRRVTLNVPAGYEVKVAAEGLRRVRFLAKAPDGRLFVTDMYNRTDNRRGKVYVLDGFDERSGRFATVTPYLTGLRNPNSVAFYTDAAGVHWLYLALTDKLVRYRYAAGSETATEPETIATFPDYGLDYKYGGWHLTRTVAAGPNGKIYVSVGSSCNACEEKEDVRAAILEMSPDGSNRRLFATGLRNAVGLRFVNETLYATNMGADHLGDDIPNDVLYALRDGAGYGWPSCYPARGRMHADAAHKKIDCRQIPQPLAAFPAHASPLGFDVFDDRSFLVALHGSSKKRLGHGYRVARVHHDGRVEDFVTGFLQGTKIVGRPADVYRMQNDAFLVSDDYAGVVYLVRRKR